MLGEYDAGYENYIDSLIREIEKLQDENDKLSEQVSSLVGRSFRTADKMSCIEDDNAKLREELEAAKHDLQVFSMGSVQLEAENAKLRELVRDMWKPFCWAQSGYEVCLTHEQDVAIRRRVCELGVEVDE